MSDLLSAAAQAMGVPEPIAERSARARAAASGQSYEDILAAWKWRPGDRAARQLRGAPASTRRASPGRRPLPPRPAAPAAPAAR